MVVLYGCLYYWFIILIYMVVLYVDLYDWLMVALYDWFLWLINMIGFYG